MKPDNDRRDHSTALWAGLTALFTNLAAVQVITLLGSENIKTQAIAALITAIVVAGGVYSKQRWDDAKAERAERAGGERRGAVQEPSDS